MALKEVSVLLRLDDYSSKSSLEFERSLIELLVRNEMSCVVGVVPSVCSGDEFDTGVQEEIPLSSEKVALLKSAIDAAAVEVALHGYSHQCGVDRVNGHIPTELALRGYEEQLSRLRRGRLLLEAALGVVVDIVVPPWNSYDGDTLLVLRELKFSWLFVGPRFGDATSTGDLRYLPATCEIGDLKDRVDLARRVGDERPLIVVWFHEYDFREFDEGRGQYCVDELDELLGWLASQRDVRVTSIDELDKSGRDLGPGLFRLYRSLVVHRRLVPPFLHGFLSPRFYLSKRTLLRWFVRYWLVVGTLYTSFVAIAAGATYALLTSTASYTFPSVALLVVGSSLLLARFGWRRALGRKVYYRSLMLTAVVLGADVAALAFFVGACL